MVVHNQMLQTNDISQENNPRIGSKSIKVFCGKACLWRWPSFSCSQHPLHIACTDPGGRAIWEIFRNCCSNWNMIRRSLGIVNAIDCVANPVQTILSCTFLFSLVTLAAKWTEVPSPHSPSWKMVHLKRGRQIHYWAQEDLRRLEVRTLKPHLLSSVSSSLQPIQEELQWEGGPSTCVISQTCWNEGSTPSPEQNDQCLSSALTTYTLDPIEQLSF